MLIENYISHVDRKTACYLQIKQNNNSVCNKCDKVFKHDSSLYRHAKKCEPVYSVKGSNEYNV